jgi:hypothetical protein
VTILQFGYAQGSWYRKRQRCSDCDCSLVCGGDRQTNAARDRKPQKACGWLELAAQGEC